MFRGLNKISLDAKGRVSIPTKYRNELINGKIDKECLLISNNLIK